ncbi:MAG: hypothetical protein WCI77_07880 [Candidatus Omnitrophota bacterium]
MKVLPVEKRCLSVTELANYLSISRAFIHQEYPKWCLNYGIRIYKVGASARKKVLFEKQDIDQKLLPNLQVV